MAKILGLMVAGALGTWLRYVMITQIGQQASLQAWPLGTLVVNVVGCFLAGMASVLVSQRLGFSEEMGMIVMVGFFGAFTTFSALAMDTMQLLKQSQWLMAIANLILQNVLGIAFLWLGLLLGRKIA